MWSRGREERAPIDVRVFFTAPAANNQNGYDILRAEGSCSILADNSAFALVKTLTGIHHGRIVYPSSSDAASKQETPTPSIRSA